MKNVDKDEQLLKQLKKFGINPTEIFTEEDIRKSFEEDIKNLPDKYRGGV